MLRLVLRRRCPWLPRACRACLSLGVDYPLRVRRGSFWQWGQRWQSVLPGPRRRSQHPRPSPSAGPLLVRHSPRDRRRGSTRRARAPSGEGSRVWLLAVRASPLEAQSIRSSWAEDGSHFSKPALVNGVWACGLLRSHGRDTYRYMVRSRNLRTGEEIQCEAGGGIAQEERTRGSTTSFFPSTDPSPQAGGYTQRPRCRSHGNAS